jgi:hypothetical protein
MFVLGEEMQEERQVRFLEVFFILTIRNKNGSELEYMSTRKINSRPA